MGACKSRGATVWRTVQNDFLVLHMPKHILIQNTRLGTVFRVLQFACLIALAMYMLFGDAYYVRASPSPKGIMLWRETPNPQRVSQSDVQHCRQPQRYAYNWTTSNRFSFAPTSCKELIGEEILLQSRSEHEIAFATHIQDTVHWHGSGDQCGADTRRWCLNMSVRASYSPNSSSNGSCSCSLIDDFFVKNPEEQKITFVHGFEVDFGEGDESGNLQQGGQNRVAFFSSSSTKAVDMLTVIMLPDYTDTCAVSGKSEWKRTDLANGITGTIREWLNCAGVTMDSNPEGILQDSAVGMSPHLRTMGFRLDLILEYTNDADTYPDYTIICIVTVQVVPTWQRQTSTDYVILGALDRGRRAWRNRLTHGVVVRLKVTGTFRKFDFKKFMDFFVSSLVLLQLPFHISEFIALYMLGFISEIHRSAKRSKLNVSNDFYSTIARMLVAEIGFRGLMKGQWKGSITHLSGLTSQALLKHITGVFDEEIQSGVLQRHELQRMAIATFSHLDQHRKGVINANDFIRECTSNESISVTNAAKLFDEEQGYGLLQRMLDSSHSQRKKIFEMTEKRTDIRRSMTLSDGSDDEDEAGHDSHEEFSPGASSMSPESSRRIPHDHSALFTSTVDPTRGDSIVLEAEIEKRIQALEEKEQEMRANLEAMQLLNRIVVLEDAETRRQEAEQGKTALTKDVQVEKASLPVLEKDGKTVSAHQISAEKGEKACQIGHAISVDKAKGSTDEYQQIMNLVTKTQHLDDAIAHLREKMELQVMRLQAMMDQQERQICAALEQRCNAIEDRLQESVENMQQQTLLAMEGHLEMETTKNTLCSAWAASMASSDDGHAGVVVEHPQPLQRKASNMLSEDDDEPGPPPHTARTHAGLNDTPKRPQTISVWHPFADGAATERQYKRSDSDRSPNWQDRRSDSEGSLRGWGSGAKGSSARTSSNIRGGRPFH